MHLSEHEKSTTEELQFQVSDDTRLEVLRVLLTNPETMLTYRDIGEVLDIHWQQPRRILKEFEQDEYVVGNQTFEGIVYSEQDGRALVWQLKPDVRARLEGPEVRVEERTVPRHDSLTDFVQAHKTRIAKFETAYVVFVAGLLFLAEVLVEPGYSRVFLVLMLVVSSLGVLAALVLIGYHETQ